MRNAVRSSFVLMLYVMLAACASVPAPESLAQGIAYGYSTVAGVRNTAAGLLQAKKISVSDAKMVQSTADQARVALDLAAEASKLGKPIDAQSALTLATNVLGNLESFLKARGG